MLMRLFCDDYLINRENRFPSLEAYTAYRVQKDWHMSLEEAQVKAIENFKKNLVPYDKARFGDLPEILTHYANESNKFTENISQSSAWLEAEVQLTHTHNKKVETHYYLILFS